jgi:hypothetical protein
VISIDIHQRDVEIILAALKTAESAYTTNGQWVASKTISKINQALHKQIYGFVKG